MSVVLRNIAANATGAAVGLVVFLAAIPLYLRLLGAEAYGLVGLFTTVMIAATAFDLGVAATLNREIARMTAGRLDAAGFADAAVTLQAGGWLVGLGGGVVFAALAPAIAGRWLQPAALSTAEVRGALLLMAVAVPAVAARGVYLAGLNGLQRQGLANVIHTGGILVRAAVTVAALVLIAPTVTVFFVTQALLLYVESLALRAALSRALPGALAAGRFRPRSVWHLVAFSGGLGGTMLLGFALSSVDQVILSAILPLAEFGYYTLAVAAANALNQVVQPVTTAVYPRFSQLVERGDARGAAEDYHFFSQLVTVLVLPAGCLLAFFPGEILTLWTRSPEAAQAAAAVLALRATGTVLNALMHVPHVMQLASGWSSLGVWVNALALVVVVPATAVLGLAAGGAGAALVWVALNLAMLVFAMARMHTRVLPGELPRWYGHVVLPALAAAVITALARTAMPDALGSAGQIGWLAATGAVAAGGALLAASTVRRRVIAAATARPA